MPLNGTLEANSLYIILKSRPRPGEFHWGLVLTDSEIVPVLHHATNLSGPWQYQVKEVDPNKSLSLIVLIKVDGIKSRSRTMDVIRNTPADGSPSPRTGEGFTCRTWLKDALVALHNDGEISLPKDIDALEATAVKHGCDYSATAESGGGATVLDSFLGA